MIRISWDVEELVALIDVYQRSEGKSDSQIDAELLELSHVLINRAEKLEISHDEKFRNLNGMKMMFQNVVYIATGGQKGMSSVSSSMRMVYEMSKTAPGVFELILKEFCRRYRGQAE